MTGLQKFTGFKGVCAFDYLQTMTEIDLQLCAVHLQLVMEHLPET